MTFVEFKKLLLDAEISLPKFAQLIKVSEKNIQACKKKGEVPNSIAVNAKCFALLNSMGINYTDEINSLELIKKSKKSGFASKSSEKKPNDDN